MKINLSIKNRLYFTGFVTLFIFVQLIWDFYHGGVPVHHLFNQENLPGFSNWWGLGLIPSLTWFLLYRIKKRVSLKLETQDVTINYSTLISAFLGSLFMGILISVLFTLGFEDLLGYIMLGLLLVGIFLPTYRSEYLVGFIIGMTYTFGGILPVLIGSVLVLAGFLMHCLIRPVIIYLGTQLHLVPRSKRCH